MSRLLGRADTLLGIGLAALYVVEAWLFDAWPGRAAVSFSELGLVLGLGLGIAFLASLAWRRRVPLISLGFAIVALAVADLLRGSLEAAAIGVGVVVTSYSVGAHTRGIAAWIGFIGVVGLIPTAVAQPPGPGGLQPPDPGDLFFFASLLVGPWIMGRAFRYRREREAALESRAVELERTREERAQAAVLEERRRIARELHDVIAHAISVIVLQARGGLRSLDQRPAETREALRAIEASGSLALAEARRLLGLLREPTDASSRAPLPSLRHVASLATRVQDAGLPVEVQIQGEATELPAGLDLAAYRIVQEALTNALKHAGPTSARVVIRYRPTELELEITNSGDRVQSPGPDGHGLVGMRERVLLYGGTVRAIPLAGGGFRVHAVLPLTQDQA